MAHLIDGAALAARIREQVRARAADLAQSGRRVNLVAVLVGSTAAGELYAQRQKETCGAVGIEYELVTLPADATFDDVAGTIQRLNRDLAVTGIMLHLPLPEHLDATELQYQIDPVKDVEGVNPANIGYVVYGHTLIAPCTALAVIELIQSTGVPLRGAEAVVVGASEIAGKPIALLSSTIGMDSESIALANSPKFANIINRSRARHSAEGGIPLAEVYRRYGLKPRSRNGTRRKSS